VTWGADKKWYEFPRAPFDIGWIPRRDVSAIANQVDTNTAAVIVEPVQGVGGAFDMGHEFLAALRARCNETGTVLIFDEVQIGVGRSGQPFAAQFYDVMPDMITTAKALGNGFPCGALLMTPRVTGALKLEGLGTTFGGGPMACAAIEAVIDAIENEKLLENVRRVAKYLRDTCTVGPVTGHQGAGFLHGLICSRPAKDIQKTLLERNILVGTSGDPNVVRLLPPYILQEKHVDLLREALLDL
jgi:acetylornithine/succinyldiaminopimelate/putrescine aminotransferase